MNDRMYDSMSAYSPISEMTRKINQILDSTVGISVAIANSTRLMRDVENATKLAGTVMPMFETSKWLKNNISMEYLTAGSVLQVYSKVFDYPKLSLIPSWVHDLNIPAHNILKDVIAVQNKLSFSMPIFAENSTCKHLMSITSVLKDLDATSKGMADIMKISESITRFDSSVNHLYKFINGFNDDDEYLIDIQSQLTASFNIDFESAVTEDKKVVMTWVFQSLLDTLSNISTDFTLEKEKKLLLTKLKSFYDQWKKEGMVYSSIALLCFLFQPVIQHYHEEFFDLEDDKPAVIINKSKVKNNYINESSIQVVTTAIKFLKERPDNRIKVKLEIPVGTKINIVQDTEKWVKVKFVLDGVYYSGWILNNNL